MFIKFLKVRMRHVFVGAFMAMSVWAAANVTVTTTDKSNLGDVIAQIRSESGYEFFYDDAIMSTRVKAAVIKDRPVEEALKKLLEGTSVTYYIDGKHIYLKKGAQAQKTEKPVSGKKHKISGKILDENGEPLIGVTVRVKGSKAAVTTDLDGNYTIESDVPHPVITAQYIGYKPNESKTQGDVANFSMLPMATDLDEIVVTALGIKREQKSLSYNVQQINGDALTTNRDANFVNSLAGKVAGVNINASSSGTGGISKVVMRGTKSIMQSSNALYVVDGMPMRGARSSGDTGAFGSAGATEPIADINPDDIESMSVLTGAAAAALYGSDAANGAIVITTKKGQAGRTKITVGSNLEWNEAFVLPRFQTRYGAGTNGEVNPTSPSSWGARLTPYNTYAYNVGDDYLQTGFVATNSVTFSTGNDKNQTYASAASVNSKGIVPNNRYDRYNFSVRNTTSFLDDKMTLDVNASYIRQTDRNMINQGVYMNPLVGAYLYPRGNDWENVRMYETYDPSRQFSVQNWNLGDYNLVAQNPYWINYRNLRENYKDRYMLGAQLQYKLLPYLTLSGRVRIDNSNTNYEDKRYASTNNQMTGLSDNGYYGFTQYKDKQIFADFLVSFNKDLSRDWNLQANFGGSISDTQFRSNDTRGAISDGKGSYEGINPGLPNFFALQNLAQGKVTVMQDGWHEQTQSLYASADLGFKQTYYLTLTGRNDWPSQLAGPRSQKSCYFYPSVGLSILMTQMFADAGINIPREYLTFWKIRASWADVGTAFTRGLANPGYEWNSQTNTWAVKTQYPMYNLLPERTKSWEVGMNFRLFNDLQLDATWYQANTHNQTFNPGLAAGEWSKIYIQTGNVRNWGMEFAVRYDHTWGNFSWDTGVTYSFNRNKIIELGRNAINPTNGQPLAVEQLEVGDALGATHFILREGGSMGDIYSTQELLRDHNGNIYIDQTGSAAPSTIKDKDEYIKLGSVLPKGNLAWSNTFRWKNLSASCMFSARFGGVVFSRTQALLDYWGVSEESGLARDLGYVELPDGNRVNPEQWYANIAGGDMIPQYYVYSATNVRLQEATISYLIPRKILGNVCDIRLSLVGRNLWMIYNKAPFDPESVASAGNFYQGLDNFMMPSLRNFGFNVNFNF